MHLDLSTLRERHSRLPMSTALEMQHRAALGLQRAGHRPEGTAIALEIEAVASAGSLSWPPADAAGLDQLDHHRVTEDAAEAIGLLLAHAAQRWSVVRRLQRFESADWLLDRMAEGKSETLALEISGLAAGSPEARLREKMAQVAACHWADQRAAAVIGLAAPLATFRSLEAGV